MCKNLKMRTSKKLRSCFCKYLCTWRHACYFFLSDREKFRLSEFDWLLADEPCEPMKFNQLFFGSLTSSKVSHSLSPLAPTLFASPPFSWSCDEDKKIVRERLENFFAFYFLLNFGSCLSPPVQLCFGLIQEKRQCRKNRCSSFLHHQSCHDFLRFLASRPCAHFL